MIDLRLAKLPDRTPVKITFTAMPDLNRKLHHYAAFYRATYGEAEEVAELIPYMLESFLESDRGFVKALKEQPLELPTEADLPRGRRRLSMSSAPKQAQED